MKGVLLDRVTRANSYREYLAELGYRPEVDGDGDIVFKHEGRTYCIILSEKDDTYFQLVYPNFWKIEGAEERAKVILASVTATADTKVAKVYPVNDNVWACIEMFCATPEAVKPVFNRAISALAAGVGKFVDKMRSS